MLAPCTLMAALMIGCGGNENDGLYGTSTKKASIQPVKPALPPVQPSTPATAAARMVA